MGTGAGARACSSVPHSWLLSLQGAALASMAGLMTYGRRQFEHLDATMRRLIPPFHAASAELTTLVDADAHAFQACLVRAEGLHGHRGGPERERGQGRRSGGCGKRRCLETRSSW